MVGNERKRPLSIETNPKRAKSSCCQSHPIDEDGKITPASVLEHALLFDCADSRNEDATFHSSLSVLVSFLEDESRHSSSSSFPESLSKSEVSLLVLPWCVKKVLSSPQSTPISGVLMRSLAVSLKFGRKIVADPFATQEASQIQQMLNQSTLFKLVPKVAQFTLSTLTADTDVHNALEVFVVLCEAFFYPTIDVACNQLLLPIIERVNKTNGQEDKTVEKAVVETTIRLLHKLQQNRKSNPRTVFQLLARKPVLVALARCYSLFQRKTICLSDLDLFEADNQVQAIIRSMFDEGFFDSVNHMEGFRSVFVRKRGLAIPESVGIGESSLEKGTGAYRCYQDELMDSLVGLLTPPPKQMEKPDTQSDEMAAFDIVLIFPVLFRGFLEQSQGWCVAGRAAPKGKSVKTETVRAMQFALFTRWSNMLLSLLNSASLTAVALHSLRGMLQLVLEYDVYSRQSETENQLLKQIVSRAFDVVNDDKLLPESMHVLKLLLELNHSLFHSNIENVIVACSLAQSAQAERAAIALLASVFTTYRKLRQQQHVIGAYLDCVSGKLASQPSRLEKLSSFLEKELVFSAFAEAVRDSPLVQIQEVFEQINRHACDLATRAFENENVTFLVINVTTQVALLTLNNTRVDLSTASDVSNLCQQLLGDGIRSLASASTNSVSRRAILALYGQCLDLHDRCAFWLEKGALVGNLDIMLKFLLEAFVAVKHEGSRYADEPWLDSAVNIAIKRIRLLNSSVQGAKGVGVPSDTHVEETSQLIEFIACAAGVNSSFARPNKSWMSMASHFSIWSAFANDQLLLSFLESVLFVVSAQPDDAYREAARCLLSDLSFIDNPAILSNVALAAMKISCRFLAEAFSGEIDSESRRLSQALETAMGHQTGLVSKSFLLLGAESANQEHLIGQLQSPSRLFDALAKCSECVAIAGAMPIYSSCEIGEEIASAHALEGCCLALRRSSGQVLLQSIKLVTALRHLLTRFFDRKEVSSHVFGVDRGSFVCHLINSCTCLSEEFLSDGEKELIDLTSATRDLLGAVISCAWNGSNSLEVSACIKQVANRETASSRHQVLAALCRGIVGGLAELSRFGFADSFDSGLLPLVEELWRVAVSIESARTVDYPYDAPDEGLLLFADLNRSRLGSCPHLLLGKKGKIMRTCTTAIHRSPTVMSHICRVLISLSDGESAPPIVLSLIESSPSMSTTTPIFEATFAHLLLLLDEADFKSALSALLRTCEIKLGVAELRLLLIFISATNDYEDKERIMKYESEKVANLALGALTCDHLEPDWEERVTNGSVVLEDVLKKRDFLALREPELALWLSHIAEVLSAFRVTKQSSVLPRTIYANCVSLFSIIFQRYSKTLYSCTPSVVMVLRCLLREALRTDEKLPVDVAYDSRHRLFHRSCELLTPHRDVYKKHLVSLILDLLSGIKQPGFVRRGGLTPALYCMLDMLTQHELKHLNGIMDSETKLSFRPIYQAYQKQHAYRGQ